MPEGPEVKTIANWLEPRIAGKVISAIRVISGRYTRNPANFLSLTGVAARILVKGKFSGIQVETAAAETAFLVYTLGMTGSWSLSQGKHSRVQILFADGLEIFFNDIRNFGTLNLMSSERFYEKLRTLGTDPLREGERQAVQTICNFQRGKPAPTLAEFLMDQRKFAGIGNYLKSEILFQARLSPHRLINSLSDHEIATLAESIVKVSRLSFELGGARIRTYNNPFETGDNFADRMKVYGKKSYKQFAVVKETTKDKRSTFWVPDIQC